jgi:hypothetical protein
MGATRIPPDTAADRAARRLLAALDRAAAAQHEVEAARAALDRAAARGCLRLIDVEQDEEARLPGSAWIAEDARRQRETAEEGRPDAD